MHRRAAAGPEFPQEMTADNAAPASFEGRDRPWRWESSPRVETPVEALPEQADVAVVGSGYAGLAAALKLSRSGRDVVVLDAGIPESGASSRAGGMIGGGHILPFELLLRRFGESQATALLQEPDCVGVH